jgi:hypothetical protein
VRYTFDALGLIADQADLILRLHQQYPDGLRLAIIDTLNRSMDGDENSAQDMRNYLGAAERISNEFSCTVIIIHHCGRNGERPRGSTAIDGSIDLLMRVQQQEDKTIFAVIEAAKEMKPGLAVVSRIESCFVGVDADGEDYFSAIAAPPEGGTGVTNREALGQAVEKKATKPKAEKRNVAFDLLKRLIVDGKSFNPDGDESRGNVLAVPEGEWAKAYRRKMEEQPDKERKPESIDRAFRRDKKLLIEAKLVDMHAGHVWLVSDEPKRQRRAD